jgi:DNA uptake protein ComE-like DNA-binding protein
MKGNFFNRLAIFSSSQRKGIFILLFLIVVIQVSYYFYKTSNSNFSDFNLNEDNISYYQSQIDSLKQTKSKRKIFPFNPNFIDDSKGYFLKMKTSEIDKLLAFRKQDKYVNSVKEFQQVTGVSDEWLAEYSPYFKFPEWTKQKANSQSATQYVSKAEIISVIDINRATKEELMLVKGIGPVFADRIISERTKYNGFVHLDQLQFINGLPPEVGVNLKRYFKIGSKPKIQKININTASKEELSKIPYITYQLSREILIYRSKSDNLLKIEDMKKIKGFPLDKLNIITLYLDY